MTCDTLIVYCVCVKEKIQTHTFRQDLRKLHIQTTESHTGAEPQREKEGEVGGARDTAL